MLIKVKDDKDKRKLAEYLIILISIFDGSLGLKAEFQMHCS